MEKFVISIANGPGNLAHNRRQESAIKTHIAYHKSDQNLTLVDLDPRSVYQDLFGKGLKAFNSYMIEHNRKDLCIFDYYQSQSRKEGIKPFYELVIQVGSIHRQIDDSSFNKMILTQFLQSFIASSPNMAVIGAYIHCDESTDHLHLDFIPFYHPKNALQFEENLPDQRDLSDSEPKPMQVQKTNRIDYLKPPLLSSYSAAVKEMGYESAREWKSMLNREFQKILYGYNIEIEPMAKSEGHIVSRKIYKDVCHEVKLRKEALLKSVELEIHKEKSRLYELEKERLQLEKAAKAEIEKSHKEIEVSKEIELELKDYTKELLTKTKELEDIYNHKVVEVNSIEQEAEKAFARVEQEYADQIDLLYEQTSSLQKELSNELSVFQSQLLSQLEREVDAELARALKYAQSYSLELEGRIKVGLQNSKEKVIESILQEPELFSDLKEHLINRLLSKPVQSLLHHITAEMEFSRQTENQPEKNKSIALNLEQAEDLIEAISSLDSRLEREIESQMAYQLDQKADEILPILELDIKESLESTKKPSFVSTIKEKESDYIQKSRLKSLKPKLSINPKLNLSSRQNLAPVAKEPELPRDIQSNLADIDLQQKRVDYSDLPLGDFQAEGEKEKPREPFKELYLSETFEEKLNEQPENSENMESSESKDQDISPEQEPDQTDPEREDPTLQPDFMEQSERMLESMEQNEKESEQALKKMKLFELELEL